MHSNALRLVLASAGLIVAALVSGCILTNRFYEPPPLETAAYAPPPSNTGSPAPNILRLATWNVGYAGMGAESDFVADLGTQSRPLSEDLVVRNTAALARQVKALNADVLLLQEAARPSWNTYGHDVLADLAAALPEYGYSFGADIDTRFVPQPFKIEIGNATFSRVTIEDAERRALPLEPNFQFGLFRKGYRMHILRLAGVANWVIVNIHLAAFDDSGDAVRERQMQAVLDFAQREFAAGRHVVIGGDWNLRLAPTEFSHQTDPKYLFWVRDLKPASLPDGWLLAVDRDKPTVRTANQPYRSGENYRLIIDGFLLSPNVRLRSVETTDLDFVHSDHNPVVLEVSAR